MIETSQSLKMQLADLNDEKSNLVAQKNSAQSEMSEINATFRMNKRMTPGQYQKILGRQSEVQRTCTMLDAKLSDVKSKMFRINQLVTACSQDQGAKNEKKESIRRAIVDLRDKYIEFGSDGTRVSSMRLMATNFAKELDAILSKPHEF